MILKFMPSLEALGNKTKEMHHSSLILELFLLLYSCKPSEQWINYNTVYIKIRLSLFTPTNPDRPRLKGLYPVSLQQQSMFLRFFLA